MQQYDGNGDAFVFASGKKKNTNSLQKAFDLLGDLRGAKLG